MNSFDLTGLLRELSMCRAPSGFEESAIELLEEKLSDICDSVKILRDGTVVGRFYGDGGGCAAVCAHMDEVGFMISSHSDDGTMPPAPLGVDEPKLLAGRRVAITGRDGGICRGYIGVTPVHLSKGKDEPTYRDLYADIGAEDKADAMTLVEKGAFGTYDTSFEPLGVGFAKGKALSSRGACAAAVYAARLIRDSGRKPQRDVVFAFTCRGELTLSGVTSAVRRIAPTELFVIGGADVRDLPGDETPLAMGGGAAVTAVSLSPADTELSARLFAVAKDVGIPVQKGIGPSAEAKRAASGAVAPSLSVDIPVRGMKSASEVVSVADVASCGKLLAEVLMDR